MAADGETPTTGGSLSPRDLGARGSALWSAVTKDATFDAAGLVILAEACRITDRLEQLHRLIDGDEVVWAHLVHDLRTEDYELKIDGAMVEARQQATTLRLLLRQLQLGKAAAGEQKGSIVDELERRRAVRRAAAPAASRPLGG